MRNEVRETVKRRDCRKLPGCELSFSFCLKGGRTKRTKYKETTGATFGSELKHFQRKTIVASYHAHLAL